jgi:hypothetical protein
MYACRIDSVNEDPVRSSSELKTVTKLADLNVEESKLEEDADEAKLSKTCYARCLFTVCF